MAKKKMFEKVNHPKHYNDHPAGIECIDVIEEMTFNVGSAIKYAWRAGLKPGETSQSDLEKAKWYLNREQRRLAGDKTRLKFNSDRAVEKKKKRTGR